MNEQSMAENAGALGVAAKVLGSPALIGILAGALGFLWSWPATRREGFVRIAAAGICSIFFGPALLQTLLHFALWFTREEVSAPCYLVAGLPGWWVLAWVFKWLDNRRGKDLGEVAHDLEEDATHLKEFL